MTLRMNPYLVMDGNTREAIQFYEKALGAKVISIQTFGEMPEDPAFPLPDAAKDRIAHALLKVGETDLMFSDTFPGQPMIQGNQVSICITTDDPEKSRTIFAALLEGGRVGMPIQETFWSPAFGELTDKYGVKFSVTTEIIS